LGLLTAFAASLPEAPVCPRRADPSLRWGGTYAGAFESQYYKCSRVCTLYSFQFGRVDCHTRTHPRMACGCITSIVTSFREYCSHHPHHCSRAAIPLSWDRETHMACKHLSRTTATMVTPSRLLCLHLSFSCNSAALLECSPGPGSSFRTCCTACNNRQ
jgi:hypothetical protein